MRSFKSGAQRQRLAEQLPKRRCSAKSSRTGQPCGAWAIVGGSVCVAHGGAARQVRTAAAQRITLAEALATNDQRPPGEILTEAVHIADVLMRQERAHVTTGEDAPTAALVEKLVSALERAARLAKTGMDAGVDERRVRLAEAQAQQMHGFVLRVLAGLSLTAEQKALVPGLVRREVEGVLAIEGQATETVTTVGRPVRKPAAAAATAPRQLATVAPAPPIVDAAVHPAREPSTATVVPDPTPEPVVVATPPAVSNGHRADKPVVVSRPRDPQSELGPFGDRGWS